MKNYFTLTLLLFTFLIGTGQEITIKKNKTELLKVSKNNEKVTISYTPVHYLPSKVELKKQTNFTLAQKEYDQLLSELLFSIKNGEEKELRFQKLVIKIEYEKTFYLFSKTKIGNKFLKTEKQIRFSVNDADYSAYFNKKDLKKLLKQSS